MTRRAYDVTGLPPNCRGSPTPKAGSPMGTILSSVTAHLPPHAAAAAVPRNSTIFEPVVLAGNHG
ncbi:hypothetical protein ACRE_086460 [Hapsidospora chrysogenum ATCC 11550]|uniref:Uncharacterized protein n=1 Tax=Hapsidospora chrysogenum (strain ATCC 11550 / CBS 779.69 / DSM 880 / IAM 14645 / JCM 23072 / IMI 49137) TaxID=857340 RepID=A0A086SU84_HAPC1|nr:hypothetical protein ACRE_086460 [Hapsidospora chrysogenum ATCC 11550]